MSADLDPLTSLSYTRVASRRCTYYVHVHDLSRILSGCEDRREPLYRERATYLRPLRFDSSAEATALECLRGEAYKPRRQHVATRPNGGKYLF